MDLVQRAMDAGPAFWTAGIALAGCAGLSLAVAALFQRLNHVHATYAANQDAMVATLVEQAGAAATTQSAREAQSAALRRIADAHEMMMLRQERVLALVEQIAGDSARAAALLEAIRSSR